MATEETIEVYIPVEAFAENQFSASTYAVECLRRWGVPVIGPVGVISVETGKLVMSVEWDGEQCVVYRWTGVPMAQHLRKTWYTLEHSLAQFIQEENDL